MVSRLGIFRVYLPDFHGARLSCGITVHGLATVTVNEGNEVTAGQVVATISSPETEAQLRNAQAQLLHSDAAVFRAVVVPSAGLPRARSLMIRVVRGGKEREHR
jgi:hypothetical protein